MSIYESREPILLYTAKETFKDVIKLWILRWKIILHYKSRPNKAAKSFQEKRDSNHWKSMDDDYRNQNNK